jgi:nucleoside-diphosphate-sugar epimerase
VTILVTGATGLVGREFLRLAGGGSETLALARDPPAIDSSTADGPTRWLQVDLRDPAFAQRLPARADAILHLAQSREYRDFPVGAVDVADVNLGATARLLDYARGAGVQRFVFASTATIYEPSHAPLSESSPIRCTSFYAASKRAAELLIEQYGELMSCWLMRIFTVYGVGQRDQLIANLVRRVEAGEPVTVQGPSGLRVSPILAADVARVLWQVATSSHAIPEPGSEVVNLGGREALGIREMAEQIAQAVGTVPQFVFSEGDDPPGWSADRTKLDRMFPLPEPLSFAAGIRETLAATGEGRVRG